MEIRLLRYFLAIAKEQTISQAAEVLHITQPTLSRQLKEFEESLGTTLFIRKDKKMYLTESGQFLKNRAEEILYLTDETEREFQIKGDILLKGNINIGCVEADNSDTLALMLEEFTEEHPQVSFSIFSGTSDDIVEKLERGLLDIAILLEPIKITNYHIFPLPRKERWGLLVSNQSYLTQKESIHLEELIGVPLLISSRNDIQQMIYSWKGIDEEDLNIVGTFNLIFNVFSLVANRVGSALTIEGAVYNRQDTEITFLPLEPEITTNCVLVWKKNHMFSPTVERFIETFQHAFEA
ncbi:LysR family transcriptional regulator [Vagococcus martis]|uniref:LysR family transcriptional regulator n=1 Tax=Vagococcus martis TaxID=1768210 RepID=A0A1V4DG57_9ENTE|nr:LysR family transcriptional regulator [Vagococcus martis]OPF87488.1 LysR family transcriptional regulator [Vagococcus martis]